MATLTIKNISDRVVKRLKARAVQHHRSLNYEVIACLEAVAQATPIDADSFLARVRSLRRTPANFRLTDKTLAQLKTAGRP
ncbi:MAG: DNA-binding protein [Nitrospirota bacterium]|nr:DNA-binding protein [Nitrospirota bacterium]MDE3226450.1 DNA-binding protein [Nitrospirota bacterium]